MISVIEFVRIMKDEGHISERVSPSALRSWITVIIKPHNYYPAISLDVIITQLILLLSPVAFDYLIVAIPRGT